MWNGLQGARMSTQRKKGICKKLFRRLYGFDMCSVALLRALHRPNTNTKICIRHQLDIKLLHFMFVQSVMRSGMDVGLCFHQPVSHWEWFTVANSLPSVIHMIRASCTQTLSTLTPSNARLSCLRLKFISKVEHHRLHVITRRTTGSFLWKFMMIMVSFAWNDFNDTFLVCKDESANTLF